MHPVHRAILDRLVDGDGPPPTRRELAEIAGLSLSGLSYHYRALVRAGWIVHEPLLARTTRITDAGRMALAAAERQE